MHGYSGGKTRLDVIDLANLWVKITILNPKGHATVHPPSTPVNLENLLSGLHPAVTPKWQQLAEVLGVDEDLIDEIFTNSNGMDVECLNDILKIWLKKSSLTWKCVADALHKIGEDQLAESSYLKCKTHHSDCVCLTNLEHRCMSGLKCIAA